MQADVRAQHQGQDTDDDQYNVLDEYIIEATEVTLRPQNADLDKRREPDTQYGQTQGAEQRYEQLQQRYGDS